MCGSKRGPRLASHSKYTSLARRTLQVARQATRARGLQVEAWLASGRARRNLNILRCSRQNLRGRVCEAHR
eukprot:9789897-Alexandrium_andersonii.AAC.1